MKLTASVCLCLFLPGYFLQAQDKGTITGVLKEAQTREMIPFAAVLLTDKKGDTLVKQGETDSSGIIRITGVRNGVFRMKISHVGYEPVSIDDVTIATASQVVNIGVVNMHPGKHNTLAGVTVTSRKEEAQIGFDKKKFAVDQSLLSKGGAAADVLQGIPAIQMNADGTVSLRGASGVNILIDGKPSLIAGGNVAQLLQSIPAGAIESIEVITHPSARYDAEGESGIINIVLLKNKKLGFNGTASATAGVHNNYGGNANVSFQNHRINLYANYGYRYGTRISNGFQYLTYLHPDDPVAFSDETFPSATVDKGSNGKAGIDYYLSKKSMISLSGSFNSQANNRNELLSIDQLDASRAPVERSHRTNLTDGKANSYDVNLDFSQTFNKPKEELSVSIGYSQGKNHNVQSYTTNVYNVDGEAIETAPAIHRNNNKETNTFYNVQLNYTLPVGKTGQIDAGYRSQIRLGERTQLAYRFNKATAVYDKYYAVSNDFNSNNQVHAVYISYRQQVKNFSYQAGVRAEDALLTSTLTGYDSSNTRSHTPGRVTNFRLYPSVSLTQKIREDQQFHLSYSRRVSRPTPRQLNPVPDVSDPVNYDKGNPLLLPEDIHLLELGYSKYWKKITLTSSWYFRHTYDFIKRVESVPVHGLIITTSQNIAHANTTGIELIGQFNLWKHLHFIANANMYHNYTAAAPAYGIEASSGYSWNVNVTGNLTVGNHFSVQIRGDYRAPDVVGQDRNHAAYGIDAGARFDFLHKKAAITFSGRDIFNSRKWSFLRESNAVLLDFERRNQNGRANLTFTYQFGKSIFASRKVKQIDEQQEAQPGNR
jgi:ferric enterobactin receptor